MNILFVNWIEFNEGYHCVYLVLIEYGHVYDWHLQQWFNVMFITEGYDNISTSLLANSAWNDAYYSG